MSEQPPIFNRRARHKVRTVTGQEIELLHQRERDFYEEARDKYLSEFSFTLSTDLRSLDRLLLLETQMYRNQWYLAAGMDYDAVDLDPKEEVALQRNVKECVNQIGEIQKDLGLTKAQRDKESSDSVGAYLNKLKIAAKEHGVKREKELGKALELTHELFALVGAYQRSNENERRKLGYESADDILTWISEYMAPEFNAIDEHFKTQQQRFWVRGL